MEKFSGEFLRPVLVNTPRRFSTIPVASGGSLPPSPPFPIYSWLSYLVLLFVSAYIWRIWLLVLFIVPDIIRRYFSLYSRRLFCLGHRPSRARPVKVAPPFPFSRGPHRNQALVLFRMGRAEALVALMSRAHSVRSKSRTRPSRDHLPRRSRGKPFVHCSGI